MKNLNAQASLADAIKHVQTTDPDYFSTFVGRVFLINDNPNFWARRIKTPTKLTSKLADKNILGFHVLAEIKNGVITDMETLKAWYDFTLANVQTDALDNNLADVVIKELQSWGMMRVEDDGTYKLSALGLVPATMYLWPQDVMHWQRGLDALDKEGQWHSDMALSYVLGTTPSVQLGYVPRNEADEVEEYTRKVQEYLPNAFVRSVLAKDLYELMSRGATSPKIRSFQYDMERIQSALTRINGIYKWNHENVLDSLGIRIKYGIKADLVVLCSLPGIGGARAKKLYNAGVKTIADVKANRAKVSTLVGKGIAMQIFRNFDNAGEYVNE